jgi:zinc transporter
MPPRKARQDALDHRGGLLGAYRLHGTGLGTSVAWETLEADPLGDTEAGDLWIHLERTAPKAKAWLESHARIPRAAWPALFSDDPRPRLTHFEGDEAEVPGVVIILRGVNLNEGAAAEDMVSVRVWIDEHRIVTLRRRRIATIAAMRESLLKGNGPRDSAEFVSRLATGLNDRILPVLAEMGERMDESEIQLAGGEGGVALRGEIASIRRSAIQIRRYIRPQHGVLSEFSRTAPPWFTRADRMLAHDAVDGAARIIDGLDEIRDRAAAAYEELTVLAGERATRQSARLTAVATVFLPLGLIAGIWGMNFDNLPFADRDAGVWVVVGLMVLTATLSAFAAAALARRS